MLNFQNTVKALQLKENHSEKVILQMFVLYCICV